MNTQPTPKRHRPSNKKADPTRPAGTYYPRVLDPEIATALANVVARFVHLEDQMGHVLAVLLGLPPDNQAGYVLRAIISPRGRLDVLTALLEKAPQNRHIPARYDAILNEFWSINKRRNAYVHGHWWTRDGDNSVWLAEEDEHGLAFLESRRADARELNALVKRMDDLHTTIYYGPLRDLKLGEVQLEDTPPQSDPPPRPTSDPAEGETKSPPPPRGSSPG